MNAAFYHLKSTIRLSYIRIPCGTIPVLPVYYATDDLALCLGFFSTLFEGEVRRLSKIPLPEHDPIDQAWNNEWLPGHDQAMLDPLDGISLYMLFQQLEPLLPEEEYCWDPEPAWQFLLGFDPNPLQGYALPDYMTHFVEDDLIQEEHLILGECFVPSTIDRLVNSVSDTEYDPAFYIIDEGLPRPIVPFLNREDCGIMVMDLVPLADLWDVDDVVNVQVGTEVWTINRSLADGKLWDVPFITDLKPVAEIAVVKGLDFWDTLLIKDLAEDLGLDMEVPIVAPGIDKGKRKLGEVPADLWDIDQ